jgi:hypothetical protein
MLKDLPAQTRSGAEPPDVIAPLILDLLQWLAAGPRTYAEVMESWRTSCPRLTVWEDAIDGGYVVRRRAGAGHLLVEATPRGRDLLVAAGRA